jgi:hypothetical protein
MATDINETVINIAAKKDFSNKQVSFELADLYNFRDHNKFESLFGCFIWSHTLLYGKNVCSQTNKDLWTYCSSQQH